MLDTYAGPGDLLVAFSGSGHSENVLNACRMAHERDSLEAARMSLKYLKSL